MTDSYDLIIRNSTLIDGSGAPRRQADVAVKDGKIARVSGAYEIQAKAQKEIDATDKLLAPG